MPGTVGELVTTRSEVHTKHMQQNRQQSFHVPAITRINGARDITYAVMHLVVVFFTALIRDEVDKERRKKEKISVFEMQISIRSYNVQGGPLITECLYVLKVVPSPSPQ